MPMALKKMSHTIPKKISSPQFPSTPSSDRPIGQHKTSLRIITWRAGLPKASFYIQCKGHHAGRPLSDPIPNSWAVYTTVPYLREIVFSIYKSRQLESYIIGTCIPFIRLYEYRAILGRAVQRHESYNRDNLRTIELIEAQIETMTKQVDLLKQYQTALAYKINHQIFTQS